MPRRWKKIKHYHGQDQRGIGKPMTIVYTGYYVKMGTVRERYRKGDTTVIIREREVYGSYKAQEG